MPTLDVVIDVEYSLIAHVSVVCIVILSVLLFFFFFFFNDPAPPEIYPLPLHDALPLPGDGRPAPAPRAVHAGDGVARNPGTRSRLGQRDGDECSRTPVARPRPHYRRSGRPFRPPPR